MQVRNCCSRPASRPWARSASICRTCCRRRCTCSASWPIVAGLACYVVSVGVWIVALSRVDVSLAYPMLSLGYVVNALAARWLFGEALGAMHWAGMLLILGGVLLMSRA